MIFYVLFALLILLFIACCFDRGRRHVVRGARVLWVCRASALSAAAGLLLFGYAAPARDLFAEISPGPAYWAIFLLLTLLWAVVVHYASRKAVEQQAWAAAGDALPLRPAARQALQRAYATSGAWVPRLLGLSCFASIGLGIAGASRTLGLMGQSRSLSDARDELTILLWSTAGVGLAFLIFVVFRRMPFRAAGQTRKSFLLRSLLGDPEAVVVEPEVLWFLQIFRQPGRAKRLLRYGGWRADAVAVALVGATIVCFAVAITFPDLLGYLVPRAWFIPLMLGLPVFAVSIATALSHRLNFPVLLLVAFVLAWLARLAPGFDDLQPFEARAPAGERQIELAAALKSWQGARCAEASAQDPSCGRYPIIVAAAGGASRASFMVATVLGDILDITRRPEGQFRDFASQLFAISGVSGGSVGAAMVAAALRDRGADGAPPCRSTDGLWFGHTPAGGAWNRFYGQVQAPAGWKSCLQTIAAGDFLSPAFVGLAFRDGWAGLLWAAKQWMPFIEGADRARLLELAFEKRYAAALKPPAGIWSGLRETVRAGHDLDAPTGLSRPLGYHAEGPDAWSPLLLLNATSVETGRRLIASELAPAFKPADGATQRMFPEAYDLFEVLSGPAASAANSPGVRLSTAATLSARFPVISPYGGLKPYGMPSDADRAVDGGYFENDGVTTALELAAALRRLNPTLKPIIVHITNEPTDSDVPSAAQPPTQSPTPPKPRATFWFESVLNPVTAFFGTRGGHAAEAVRNILNAESAPRSGGVAYVRFQVFKTAPDREPPSDRNVDAVCNLTKARTINQKSEPIDDLSMSWWLSGFVQDYLDRQLCHTDNVAQFDELSQYLKKRSQGDAPQ